MPSSASSPGGAGAGLPTRLLRLLRPSHQHSALSATLLLMVSVMLARLIGYLREMYVAWAFGAGPTTDAYVAAFQIPDYLFYLLAGGTTSITVTHYGADLGSPVYSQRDQFVMRKPLGHNNRQDQLAGATTRR